MLPEFGWNTPLFTAMQECEVYCVWACCGMDAYEVKADHLQRWADRVSAPDLEGVRRDVDVVLDALKEAPESFYFLDCEHKRQEVIEWFESIRLALADVKPSEKPPSGHAS